jgi:hypothetical protein
MSIHHDFYLDTPASRHALRDALVRADIGLDAVPDFKHIAQAESAATLVGIIDDLSWQSVRPDNGVIATRIVKFSFQQNGGDPRHWEEYYAQIFHGVMALLKAFPDADAYWVALDAEWPMLLRRGGHIVLSQRMAAPGELWDPARRPSYLALIDLPYTVEPLGPWGIIHLPVRQPRQQPVANE